MRAKVTKFRFQEIIYPLERRRGIEERKSVYERFTNTSFSNKDIDIIDPSYVVPVWQEFKPQPIRKLACGKPPWWNQHRHGPPWSINRFLDEFLLVWNPNIKLVGIRWLQFWNGQHLVSDQQKNSYFCLSLRRNLNWIGN